METSLLVLFMVKNSLIDKAKKIVALTKTSVIKLSKKNLELLQDKIIEKS